MIKKTYIPGKPRNPKLSTATGTSGVGKTEFNQVAGSSHEHYNKGVLDQITEAMLVAALRDLITSTDTESELTDENMLSSLRVLSEIAKNNEAFLEELKNQFLSKINPDTAQKLITFIEGIEVGTFTTGALGAGAAVKMIDGTSYAEVDNLTVRQKATFRELIIEALKHIGGQLILSPARMKCNKVVDGGTYYKCYFDTGDGEVSNEFVEGDLARCQVFTGNGTKFYWRLVTLVGEDWINLSKTSAAVGSDVPEAGDDIVQLGNATDTTRQSAIILSTVGVDAPSWKQYSGINSFSLEGKETTVFSKLGNKIEGKTVFTSGGTNLDDHLDGVAQDILDALQAAQDAEDKAQQAIEDAEANVGLINTEVGKLQAQLDGEVSNWFYPYSPTLANYPASDWTTNEIKDRHIGDTFTNTAQAPAENAGKSWRFVKNGSMYSWTVIADSDAVKALLEASKAQATADGKSTTHLFQPTKYKLGDMWVLNADQTVNGTAYKQGDLLTATQDSETFVQSHWLKRVRYTDDTAIDNLEIGGRNLIVLQNVVDKNGRLKQPTNITNYIYDDAGYYTTDKIYVNEGDEVVLTSHRIISGYLALGYFDEDDIFFSRPVMVTNFEANSYVLTIPSGVAYIRVSFLGSDSDCIKLEKGNKPTDWTPAPEDVQAEIDAAKQEALSAASDAQSTANSLKDFTDTAFRDGIIDRSESVAIEKYKNTLNETMSKAEASYMKVFLNTYLEGAAKTDLEQAKINLWGQRDTLLDAINTAISGGTTTPAQKTAVDNAFSTFNNLMTAFQNALEEANKAIQAKLDALSKGYVDNLEIGGRNLLIGTSFLNGGGSIIPYGNTWTVSDVAYLPNTKSLTHSWSGGTGSGALNKGFIIYRNSMVDGVEYTFSFYGKGFGVIDVYWGGSFSIKLIDKVELAEDWYKYIYSITPNGGTIIYFRPNKNVNINYTAYINAPKLEKGSKATDWTPAPEDVQAAIDAAVAKATYWSIKASSPVIYKDAINAATAGSHTPVIVSGELRSGTTTTSGGFITVTPNGGTEAGTASASPVTIAPTNTEGKTSYTVRLYDTASKTTLLDTMTSPVVFKGASGVNAISAVLSNEADVLPASSEGVVSDYSGSGTEIRVFEGATELSYGTGNGQYQVSASGSGITVGTPSTSGNRRVYGVASNMTSDNATITFAITGKTASGASFSLTKVQAFAKSRTGQKGADGISITLVDVEFAKNTSPTTAPTTGWTTTAPTLAEGEQLWTRTKTSYSTGNPTYSTPANITPKKGDTGAVGQGVESVTEEYHISSSKTTQPAEGSAGWSTTQPTWVQGQYIWSRVKVVYKNPANTVYTGYAVSSEWEAVNDLEIGGRNYWRRSYLPSTLTGTTQSSLNGANGFNVLVGTSTNGAGTARKAGVITSNGWWVLSGYIKTNVLIGSKDNLFEFCDTPAQGTVTYNSTDWTYFEVKANVTNYSSTYNFIDFNFPAGWVWWYFKDIKLEKGNKATDWTPAPEDVQSEINKAQNEAENAKIQAERAQLQADGYMRARYIRDWVGQNSVNDWAGWSEVEVFSKDGTNIALGKTVTGIRTQHGTNIYSRITDGNINTVGQPGTLIPSGTADWIRLDLGQVYYDIDFIRIWHTWYDGRTYTKTKTEISEDGVNWTTVFDSAVEGTYYESEEGKIHTQRYASVMDRIAETEAKTRFQTLIDEGLIYTALMKLFDTISGDETAFISGKQGAGKNLPAFGAGGSYQDALAGLAKIIFRHDGTGKIGVFEVDEIGSVKIYDPDIADLLRLEFIKSKVPTVASLMSQTEAGQSKTNAAKIFISSGSAVLPNSINVTEDSAELSFSGRMELDVTFNELDGATFGSAYVGVALYKDGFNYAALGGISSGQLSNSNYSYSNSVQINKKLTVPKGVYTIVVSASFNDAIGSAGINNTSTLSWILRKDIRRFIFGSDGFASWYTENSFHFSELTGMFARGKVDIPAGLGEEVRLLGTSGRWGMVTGATRSSSTTTITHSVGDLKYTVMVTPSGSSATWYMQNKTVNSVQIISSGAFDYILVRTPN